MIKLFLKKTIIFIVVLYALLFSLLYSSNYVISKNSDFKLEPNINKIILGNSQPECAYNDTLIDNFKNLAKSGETYFYNYQKLKALIKQNPQIDTVFIEFSNANILKREDQKIWETRFINHQLPNYCTLLTWEDYQLLLIKNPVGFQKALLTSLKKNSHRIITSNYNFKDSIGDYWYLKRHKVEAILDTLTKKKQVAKKLNKTQLSEYDLEYLDKIIALCQDNNIRPCLIRSPYHPKFQVEQYEWDFKNLLNTRYKKTLFFDFKNFSLDNSEFADLQHLNYKGAAKYSKWFNKYIK